MSREDLRATSWSLIGKIAVTSGAIACFLGVALAIAFPNESFAWWALVLLIGIPAWFVLEGCGTWVLSRPFLARMSSAARVTFVVCAAIVVILAVTAIYLRGAS